MSVFVSSIYRQQQPVAARDLLVRVSELCICVFVICAPYKYDDDG
jgi:hypothetical protein